MTWCKLKLVIKLPHFLIVIILLLCLFESSNLTLLCYVILYFQSGIWEASEVETSKGSIRIQHLTAVATSLRSVSAASGATSLTGGTPSTSRFPKLEECAHFHYDYVELPVLKVKSKSPSRKNKLLL